MISTQSLWKNPNQRLPQLQKRPTVQMKKTLRKILSDEPVFKPGAKVLIHNPKTKHWDRSAIVINWRHGRTNVLEDGTQRVTRRALRPGERRHNNYYQRKKKSSIHTLWAKSAQLLFKLKFISRIKPLYKLGGMWQTGTLCHPLYILCNPNLVTPVNIRCKPCCIKLVLQLRSRDKDVN